MDIMNACCICKDPIEDGRPVVKLREKGARTINERSKLRNGSLVVSAGQTIHQDCRRDYTNLKSIKSQGREQSESTSRVLRSKELFNYKDNCLFCGQPASVSDKRRGIDTFPVRTTDFQTHIEQICKERTDVWASDVLARIQFAQDLHAADAVYHQQCSVNFRTGKNVPSGTPNQKRKSTGRPQNQESQAAFDNTVEYLIQREEEQITVIDMVNKMKELCGDLTYTAVHMKSRIQSYFGDNVIITEINGRPNVITLRKTAREILQDFHQNQSSSDPEIEKMNIIKTAASLIKSDIKSIESIKTEYPSVSDIESVERNVKYLPESLKIFLSSVFGERDLDVKLSAIGQAVIQAARPRSLIVPLQIGLAVQMHHSFGSRFLIDSLNSLGFSSSYSEVQKYELNAAATQKTDIPEVFSGSHLQYVADNVDHNIRTIDGHGTFHGMGIIATATPGFQQKRTIPRMKIDVEELKQLAKIDIQFYKLDHKQQPALTFNKLRDIQTMSYSENLSLLSASMWPLKQIGWAATCQMVYRGVYPGKSNVVFLPMIDMDPSNLTCIYSTLNFVAKEARRHNSDPVLTFDQPLYWKGMNIIHNEPDNSPLKSIVLRLGGFHTEMSFLGSIGYIMSNSGLSELLESVYAPAAVVHMLSGKAVARAIRGHFLSYAALTLLMLSELYEIPVNILDKKFWTDSLSSLRNKDNIAGSEEIVDIEHEHTIPNELIDLIDTFEKLLLGEISVESLGVNRSLDTVVNHISTFKKSFDRNHTSRLWIQYMDMIELLRRFITAERSGNWMLHLKSLQEMLPYLAASGHNLYVKSAHIYLQQMQNLQHTHPTLDAAFKSGHHVIRRSDRYWSGLSTDLVIEQALMRSIKTTGGLTRGRGLTEAQRAQWLLGMPQCAEVNESMQKFADVKYETSEQHKETGKTRTEHDSRDIGTFFEFLKERNPFSAGTVLRNIETGVTADEKVNVYRSVDIGKDVLKTMEKQQVDNYVFKRNKHAVTLASKSNPKVDGEEVSVDPQLLFQRLLAAANNLFPDISELFQYELCGNPAALFEPSGLMRLAQKASLADAIWNLGDCSTNEMLDREIRYVIDGGSLIQRIPWNKGATFGQICQTYVDFVSKKYEHSSVVFDGYVSGPNTKDHAHTRRTKGIEGTKIEFKPATPFKSKKENFLSNNQNKQAFINMLSDSLLSKGIRTVHADADADVLIARTGIASARENPTIVIGEDTDVLVLLLYHCDANSKALYYKSDQSSRRSGSLKVWDILKTRKLIGDQVCCVLPFVHAVTGCDTTSRLFGIGKGPALKKITESSELLEASKPFLEEDSTPETIVSSGLKIIAHLYGGVPYENLDVLRYRKFSSKVISNSVTFLQIQSLPPTTASAEQHCKRTFHQVIEWTNYDSNIQPNPLEWGWNLSSGKLVPIKTRLPVAPDTLLNVIRCKCKSSCDTRRCTCRKHGLPCSMACTDCKGTSCSNSEKLGIEDNNQSDDE